MKFNQHDIIVWHAHTGPLTCRVLHVYDEEPKTLLLTDNIDDPEGLGKCFHAAQCDCEFIRTGEDITKECRKRERFKHGEMPQNLIKTTQVKEDF